jgi:hypothetical protein
MRVSFKEGCSASQLNQFSLEALNKKDVSQNMLCNESETTVREMGVGHGLGSMRCKKSVHWDAGGSWREATGSSF